MFALPHHSKASLAAQQLETALGSSNHLAGFTAPANPSYARQACSGQAGGEPELHKEIAANHAASPSVLRCCFAGCSSPRDYSLLHLSIPYTTNPSTHSPQHIKHVFPVLF
jgi:hypothetical protein